MHDRQHHPETPAPVPAVDPLVDEADLILAGIALDEEIAAARAAEPRVDTKGGHLQSLAAGLALAGLALLAPGKLPPAATALAWLAVAVDGAALAVVTFALRPRLDGGHGFPRWARTAPADMITVLQQRQGHDAGCADKTRRLHWLSRTLVAKFRRLIWAQNLIIAALAIAAAAAALAAMGR